MVALISVCAHGSVMAHQNQPIEMTANFATGVAVGESVGTGLFIRKYFNTSYVQLVGAYSYGEYQPISSLAFAVGRYFYQEEISAIRMPVGLHYFFSMNSEYWHDKKQEALVPKGEEELVPVSPTSAYLYPGLGLAIDLFNPGTKGVGSSFSIGYGSRIQFVDDSYQLESLYLGAVFASASLVYNW